MIAVLPASFEPAAAGVRAIVAADEAGLGELLHRAYAGTIDDEGESLEQACAEVRKTFEGAYGEFNRECSIVVEREGRVVSATLITRYQDRPFVAFSFTDPAFKNQGLARACMVAAMGALRAQGEREVRLVVTVANAPAVALYRRLGFAFEA